MDEVEPEDMKAAIRMLRARLGWSQAELAARAGLDGSSIQRYESGRPVPYETLVGIAAAAGVSQAHLTEIFLPYVRYLRGTHGGAGEIAPASTDPGEVEAAAGRLAETAAAVVRGQVLRAWADHVERALAAADEAWRPKEIDRKRAVELWGRLAPHTPDERSLLLSCGTAFQTWALVELAADQTRATLRPLADGEADATKAQEWADLALEIASRVPGPPPWKARIRAYALASLAAALEFRRENSAAREAREEAERLWHQGQDEPGLLEEGRFREGLGGFAGG